MFDNLDIESDHKLLAVCCNIACAGLRGVLYRLEQNFLRLLSFHILHVQPVGWLYTEGIQRTSCSIQQRISGVDGVIVRRDAD